MVMRRKQRPKPNPRPKIEYPPVETKTWIPPDERPKKKKKKAAYVKPAELTVKLDISSLKKVWHKFVLHGERMLLFGHWSQYYRRYTFRSNGYQAPCNCVVAIAFAHMFDVTKWNPYYLDQILDIGDKLYLESCKFLVEKYKKEICFQEVYHTYFIYQYRITMDMKGKRYTGKLLPDMDDTPHFVDVANDFFKSNWCGVIMVANRYFAIWKINNGYFLFDPCEHEPEEGAPFDGVIGRGVCILARVHNPESMLHCILEYIRHKGDTNPKFYLVVCGILRKVEINTKYPECLDDANLEIKALTDEDRKKIEQKQIEKFLEAGKVVVTEEVDKDLVQVEDDDDDDDLEDDEEGGGDQGGEGDQDRPKADVTQEGVEEGMEAEGPPKFVWKKLQKPVEKVKAASVTYFIDIVPEKIGILRASTHQCDKRFSKYLGKQSIANAVSAVAMLRAYKAKYWTTNILDDLLKNGEVIYHDSMKAHPEEPILKINKLCEIITVYEKQYTPKIEDITVIGKLGSSQEDILDLQPALKEFFSENDTCVIEGPLTVAAWTEHGFFYMFDPYERDKNGIVIVKEIKIGSFLKVLEFEPGVACLTWYSCLKGLVETYMKNIQQNQRREQFFLHKIQLDDYLKLPEPYYNYQPLSLTRWILKGTFSQNNKKFPEETRNTQCTAMAAYAISEQQFKHIKTWDSETLDYILDEGNKLYEQSIEELQKKNKFVSRLLLMSEVKPTIILGDKELRFDIEECFINGSITNEDTDEAVPNLKTGLIKFFVDATAGVLTCRGIAVAVFLVDGDYYYFDSHARNKLGLPCFYGTSICIKTTTVEELTNFILANLPADTNNLYNLARVSVDIFEVDGVPKPPLNHYIGIDENRAILRSIWSQSDPSFGINAGKQTVPNNLVALGMTFVIPTLNWTVDIINEVLLIGDQFYEECMDHCIKEEDKEREEMLLAPPPPPPEPVVEEIPPPPPPVEEKKPKGKKKGKKDEKEEEAPPPPAVEEKKPKGKKKGKKDEKEEEAPPPPPPELPPPLVIEDSKDSDDITSTKVLKTFKIGVNKFDVEFGEVQQGTYEDLEETLKRMYIPEEGEDVDLEDRKIAIIECEHLTVVMWKEGTVHYVFDPKPRDECGQIYGRDEWSVRPPTPPEIIDEPDMETSREEPEVEDEGAGGDKDAPTSETDKTDEPSSKIEEGHEYPSGMFYEGEGMLPEEEEIFMEELFRHSSHYWREMEKNGKAYIMRFIYAEDMVRHVVENTPPTKTELPYKITMITLTNTPDLKEVFDPETTDSPITRRNVGNWNDFVEIDKGKWILRGTMTQFNEMYPVINRGKQTMCNAFTALGYQHIYSIPAFKRQTIDDIMKYGDRLYTYSFLRCKKDRSENNYQGLNDEELDLEAENDMKDMDSITREFCIAADKVTVNVSYDEVVGEVTAMEREDELDVKRGLERFFSFRKTGILFSKDLLVPIWKKGHAYYMFDPYSRGPNGAKCVNGVACITRFLDIEQMANLFLINISKDGDNRFYIHGVSLFMEPCPRQEVRKKPPKLKPTEAISSFTPITPGKTIVQGSLSQQDQMFGRRTNAQFAPMAFVALAMTLVHNPLFWTKPIVDEVVTIGDCLYACALDCLGFDFNPWEQELTLDLTPTDFKIGELKCNCEIRPDEIEGILDIRSSEVLNLRQGLEKFFEENTHGVIITENLTLPVWEEDDPKKTLYMFDPCPRGPSGMPGACPGMGVACLVSFDSSKMAADHFVSLIVDGDAHIKFEIRPIEVCVGKMKTKGKKKKKEKCSEPLTLAVFGEKISSPMEKKKMLSLMRLLRKEREAERMAKAGRKSFYTLPGNEMAILRGSRSCGSKYYSVLTRGNQDIPICLTSYVMERLVPFNQWNECVINMVLDIGDQLYKDSYVMYSPKNKKLGLACVIRDIVIKDARVSIAIGKPVLINQFSVPFVEKALEMFFRQKMYCMLCVLEQYVALFCKDEMYYMFDPHDLDLDTSKVEDGQAAVVKFTNLKRLAEVVVSNYKCGDDEEEEVIFSIIMVAIKAIQKLPMQLHKK